MSSWRGRDDSTLPIAEKQWSDDIRGSQHQQGYNLGTRTAAHRTNDDYRGRAPPLDRGQEETENLDGARRMTPPSLASRTSVDAVASLHHRGPLLVPSRPEVFQQQPQGSLIASDASSSSSLALRLAAIHAHQEALSSRRRRDSISSQSLPPPSASISQHYPFMDWRDLQVGAFTRHGAAGLSSLVATTQNPGATSRDFLVSSLVAAAAPTYSTRPNDFHDGVSRLVGITNLTSLGRRPYAAIELRESDDRVPLHHKGLDRRNAFTSIDQARGSCNTKAFASEPVGHNVGHGVASMSGAYPHLDRRILLESRDGDAIPNVPRSFHVSTTHGHTSRLSDDEGQARYSRQSMNDRKELKKKDAPSISTATPPDDNAEEDPVVRAARLGSGADMNTTIQNQRSRILFVEGDEHYLTEYQCLLRKQLEVFEAGPNDIRGSTQGRNVPISPGQVGLRCRHCANLPLAARTKGAVYYSQTIEG